MDHWTFQERDKFQKVMVIFFNLFYKMNTGATGLSGPWNVELLRIRMAEDKIGHRIPGQSVVHWRLWWVGYGYLGTSAELVVLDAFNPRSQKEIYERLAEVHLDVIVGSMTQHLANLGPPPKCHQCSENPVFSHTYPPFHTSPLKCNYTVGGETIQTPASAWQDLLLECTPINENWRYPPLGGNTMNLEGWNREDLAIYGIP